MRIDGPVEPGRPILLFAHGAGAGEDHPWIRLTAKGLADRGVTVVTFNFPYMATGRKLPDRGPVLEASLVEAWATPLGVSGRTGTPCFVGGKSMGGRIATQAVARRLLTPGPAGVVCFGYPLHPPGKPGTRRDAHLPQVPCPILFLHGTRDPFGTPDEMRELVAGLPGSSLYLVEGGDHSLVSSRRGTGSIDSAHAAALDVAATWMLGTRVSCPP